MILPESASAGADRAPVYPREVLTRLVALVLLTSVALLGAASGPGVAATASRTVPGAATVQVSLPPGSPVSGGDSVELSFAEPVATLSVTWGPAEAPQTPVAATVAATRASASLVLPGPLLQARPYRLTVAATAATGARLTRVVDYYGLVSSTQRRVGPTTRVMDSSSTVYGTKGRLFRFTIEAHRPLGSQLQTFAQESLRVLTDATRGWTAQGRYRLRRIDDPRRADIRLLLARPPLVDSLCLKANLHTGGQVSCWNHEFASLNSDRWFTGALSGGFRSLRAYRTYLINHEFGHGLHLHHAYCPRRGALAPVMQQQTGGQDGCRSNGWPYRR